MSWIEKYYGKDWMKKLSPTVVLDGKTRAVVRVVDGKSSGFVLVQKNGAHGVTPQEVLFQGLPTAIAYAAMRKRLAETDAV
jgi:hypothetical protein